MNVKRENIKIISDVTNVAMNFPVKLMCKITFLMRTVNENNQDHQMRLG